MKVTSVAHPIPVSQAVDACITSDVTAALQGIHTAEGAFMVNDTLWFAVNDRKMVTPCAVNSAKFISRAFLQNLSALGWSLEKEIIEQKIDAYIPIKEEGPAFRIPPERFLRYFEEYSGTPEGLGATRELGGLDRLFSRLYGAYVSRPFVYPGRMPSILKQHAQPDTGPVTIRVGLEFETGNIASSFRSLYKLGFLYNEREIDAGVFITSIDKSSSATRIWPTSNRNGSFQELQQRNYKRMVVLPLWEFGFAPDSFSPNAQYLGRKGNLYVATPKGKKHVFDGVAYEVFEGDGGKEILKPAGTSRLAGVP